MPKFLNNLLRKFLIWKYKHISERQFVYFLSILVGLLAGLGTVLLKNFTHFIQEVLEGKIIKDYQTTFYFIFPVIGLFIVHFIVKYVVKRKIHHGIPSTLFSISKRNGIIERYKIYASIITAPITVGFGGSVGVEAPVVLIGSTIGSNLGQFAHFSYKNRTLLIGCGAAGAISAI